MSFWSKKRPFSDTKRTKRTKTVFSLKFYFLHFLAKFKQKIANKIQKYGQKRCFWPQKVLFVYPKKELEVQKSPFQSNFTFYTFYPNLSKK